MFSFVKRKYEDGTFTKQNLQNFVVKGYIKEIEYETITGETYPTTA